MGCPRPSFAAPLGIPVVSMKTTGDFNGDGFVDLVGYDNFEIEVVLGRPGGRFGPTVVTPYGFFSLFHAVAGRFDADAAMDLVLVSDFSTTLTFLKGNGDGTFVVNASTPGPNLYVLDIDAGDLDADGVLDIAVLSQDTLALLLGAGDGTFEDPVSLVAASQSFSLAIGDFNGDGASDAVFPNPPAASVGVVYGSSTGVFSPASFVPVAGTPVTVAVLDANGDGQTDIAVGVREPLTPSPGIALLLRSGGGFSPGPTFLSMLFGIVIAGDFDGNGWDDLLLDSNYEMNVLLNGPGGFDVRSRVPTPSQYQPFVGDTDLDGTDDLLFPSDTHTLVIRGSPAGPQAPPAQISGQYRGHVATGDFDGDGDQDVAIAPGWQGNRFHYGDGQGGLAPGQYFEFLSEAFGALGYDLDEDGRDDLILIGREIGARVGVFWSEGNGQFSGPQSLDVPDGVSAVEAGDMNGDGLPDLVVVAPAINTISVFRQTAPRQFAPAQSSAAGPSPIGLALEDMNLDGKIDAVTANRSGQFGPVSFSVMFGDGLGGFTSADNYPAFGLIFDVEAADFDGDGHKDIAVAMDEPSGLDLYRGSPSGFLPPTTTPIASPPGPRLLEADFNQDGYPDVVAFGNYYAPVTVVPGDPGGPFGEMARFGLQPNSVGVGDFDGDGLTDLAVSLWTQNLDSQVAIVRNTNCRARRLAPREPMAACVAAGDLIAPAPEVEAIDDGENLVSCATGSVSAFLAAAPPGGLLTGATTAPLIAGVAAFPTLAVSASGTGYELRFTAPGLGVAGLPTFRAEAPPTIEGPARICSGSSGNWDAGSGYGSYAWFIDDAPAGNTQGISPSGLTSGLHTLSVTVGLDECLLQDEFLVQVDTDLTSVVASLTGSASVCVGGTAGLATVAETGGGEASRQWGYRIGAGPFVAIAGATGQQYRIAGDDFPAAGPYNLSVRATPACGTVMESSPIVIMVDPATAPGAPSLVAPDSVAPGSTGLVASASGSLGASFEWTLVGGTLVSGQGTSEINFDAGPPGTVMRLEVRQVSGSCPSELVQKAMTVDFMDVSETHPFHDFISVVLRNAVAAGCGGGNFCPDATTSRGQMSVFLLRALEGPDYLPPPPSGDLFADVPSGAFAAAWIEEIAARAITAGCGGDLFCPNDAVTRAQMSVFLLRTLEGPGYSPPAATGTAFLDVPTTGFAAAWIEEIARRGITAGCGGGNFCPNLATTRGQMAVFLTATFSLP